MMSSTSRTPSVRVLTYNVHGLHDDRHALASVVREAAPDVVIVQEAPRRFRWRTKCADLAHSWGMVYAAGGLPALGNLIVTTQRIRVHQTWCVRYPLTPGRHLRGAAFARCTVAGPDGHELSFVVAGTHLATDDAERPRQARAFTDAVTAITDPAIVGLDANETPGGPSWAVVADGRTDAAVARGDDRPTFPAARPTRRLDAVFVDPRWTVTRYDVIATETALAASDHLPVLVEVRPAS
jgi:endonuclease/exonuclease/phosphatase family metal-dependent hydrolase